MEFVNVQKDLQALRKLYGLFQNQQFSRNEILDEKAKVLLKNLLDGATDKALETHSKIIGTAQSDCYSKNEKLNIVPKLVSPNTMTSSHRVIQNSGKYSKKSHLNRKKRSLGFEQSGMKQQPIISTKTRSKLDGIQRKQQYMKRENGRKSLKSNIQSVRGKKMNEIKGGKYPSVVNLVAASSSNSGKPPGLHLGYNLYGKKKSDKVKSNFSRDVDNAIRRIELGILDLHDDMSTAVNPNPMQQQPIQLADGQISKRPLGHGQAQAQARARAQAVGFSSRLDSRPNQSLKHNGCAVHGLRFPLPIPRKETVLKNKKKQPTHQAIFRPTLLEADCSEIPSELESDETKTSISITSSSWKTNTSDCESDSNYSEAESFPKKLAYLGSKANDSSSVSKKSDSSSWVSSHSTIGSGVQTNQYRLYHKAVHNPEVHTAIGRLRRFKNKLGLIFHHHHHHHHHHHYHDSKVGHTNKSMWKHLQIQQENEKCGKQEVFEVDKYMRKSKDSIMQHNKHHQAQANYFCKLVKGLRHNSKKSKGGQKQKLNAQKNLHWWQIFKHNGGLKLGNRRVRLGLNKRTYKLTAH